MIVYPGARQDREHLRSPVCSTAAATLLNGRLWAALWVIVFSAIGTFILLKLVGLFVPLRMTEEDMEEGDLAVHGHEVYPSDVPSLSFPAGAAGWTPAAGHRPRPSRLARGEGGS